MPEVFGRAAAVGNSSGEPAVESKALEGTKVHDLGSTAGLTPPGTPPHQMWRPLVPAVLQGKSKMADGTRQTPTKLTIQIDPRPLPLNKLRGKVQPPATFQPFSPDHDYCLPSKESSSEVGKHCNTKQKTSITPKTTELPSERKESQQAVTQCPPVAASVCSKPSGTSNPLDEQTLNSSVLVTPDASPSRVEPEGARTSSPKHECPSGRKSRSPSPRSEKRGRSRRRRRSARSRSSSSGSSSGSSSRSRSRSPPRKRCYRSRRSDSSSSSRSRSRSRSRSQSRYQSRSPHRRRRYSYSSSCSGSWSRSRSRSSSPRSQRHWKGRQSPPQSKNYSNRERNEEVKRRKEKAIEERRVVYVGRIRASMTHAELKERFSLYGDIEDCTLHFREHGDNYGFVTYYNTKDAFTAIENGSKLRRPNELPFDLCFGGRRQFCKTSYADLDSNREYDPPSTKHKIALDFDTLLKQAQKNLKR